MNRPSRPSSAFRALLVAGAVALGLAGTGAPAAEAGAPAGHARPPGVDWFEGAIPDAFAAARAANKPVFLYWGAVWCPPCQELKATIFRRRDFLDRLRLFVPVYLDGDAAGAQAWGDTFHVTGYPTVLVLRGDQSEIERVSGGMDLSRYAEVLDLALAQGRPARELLASLGDGTAPLSASDCRQLAYNGWQLDDGWILHREPLAPLAQSLAAAARRCPAPLRVERARLQVTAVQAASEDQAKDIAAGKPVDAALASLMAPVPAILADRPLALAVGDALTGLRSAYFTAAVQLAPAQRNALRECWFALMDALSTDPRYSAADQLDALGSKLVAAKALAPDGRIPPALAASVSRRIDEALGREKEPYARASVVNSALNILDTLGDENRAQTILAGEIQTAAAPYYYMADLAELEEKRGHRELAVDWLARSFRTAQGPATRFQWGVGYVRGLVRMQPDDEGAIRNAAIAVLDELDASGDLHGRTRRSLAKLETSLREWNQDARHEATIRTVRERMQAICGKIPAGDPALPACTGFLAPA
jgi:thiol-disulfide isomerase/thioredoxin